MSTIATIVKAALALEQKIQGLIGTGAHALASRSFDHATRVEHLAVLQAVDDSLAAERLRAKRAADLHAAFKAQLSKLHSSVDQELDLIDGRKQQELARAAQYRDNAGTWQGTAIQAQVAAEAARKAAEQLS